MSVGALTRPEADAVAGSAPTPARLRLGPVVFVTGAGTLATEIAASRLLAPFFGSSTVVWANVIGLILAYLSIGYWLGGKLADRRPEPRLLGSLIVVAGGAVAALPFVAQPILTAAAHGLDRLAAGAVVGSFFSALLLFAVPVTLLGTVSPFAIRLALGGVAEAGAVAGRLYALSTVGSILGTFVSALVAIPLVGTRRTMLGSAVLIVAAGALLLGRRWQVLAVAVACLLALPAGAIKQGSGVLYEGESAYSYLRVVQDADGARRLQVNEGVVSQSVWRPHTVLTGDEWDMFLVLPPLLARPPRTMLVLGNAGGTTARAYGKLYPRVRIDGVELDPLVTQVARRYLGLGDNPRLRTITADARPYLLSTRKRYDLIVIDAYRQPYIPFYLATREFFRLVRDHLRPGGIVALNVAAVPGDHRLVRGLGMTLRSVFPQAWRWDALALNTLLLGFDRPLPRAELRSRVERVAPAAGSLAPLFARQVEPVAAGGTPWTDDHAPVEWVTDRMVVEFAARGASLRERALPTAPRS